MQSLQQRLAKLEEEIARLKNGKANKNSKKEKEVDIVAEIERIVDIKYINDLYRNK